MDDYTYFWKCCKKEHPANSIPDARAQLEAHEQKEHKGKLIGSFGKNVKKDLDIPLKWFDGYDEET